MEVTLSRTQKRLQGSQCLATNPHIGVVFRIQEREENRILPRSGSAAKHSAQGAPCRGCRTEPKSRTAGALLCPARMQLNYKPSVYAGLFVEPADGNDEHSFRSICAGSYCACLHALRSTTKAARTTSRTDCNGRPRAVARGWWRYSTDKTSAVGNAADQEQANCVVRIEVHARARSWTDTSRANATACERIGRECVPVCQVFV